MNQTVPNILADRYATDSMKEIWSPQGRVVLERQWWIAILKAQKELGLPIPDEAITAYESVIDKIDLDSIREREAVSRHDVKAKIEEFCDLAGYQEIHKGMTSRDLTENVEQLQIYKALLEIRKKTVSALSLLNQKAKEFEDIPLTARTHNVAAQITTVGRRLVMFAEELLLGYQQLESIIQNYPIRGLKGAVGTQLDPIHLFDGDLAKAAKLDELAVAHLGFNAKLQATGQVYPRSLDLRVVSTLVELASAPGNFSRTLRIMAGHELASEGFAKGQTGSSAMPHKMNSRSCERINGFHSLLKGYQVMVANLAGDQWNEGDVSCSVVRRVALPDAFYAIDGLLETFLVVLQEMELFPGVIESENEHYLPFLLATTFLMKAVQNGVGREEAHKIVKEHALSAVRNSREKNGQNDFLERISADERLGLTREEIDQMVENGRTQAGMAKTQIATIDSLITEVTKLYPKESEYRPGQIL